MDKKPGEASETTQMPIKGQEGEEEKQKTMLGRISENASGAVVGTILSAVLVGVFNIWLNSMDNAHKLEPINNVAIRDVVLRMTTQQEDYDEHQMELERQISAHIIELNLFKDSIRDDSKLLRETVALVRQSCQVLRAQVGK